MTSNKSSSQAAALRVNLEPFPRAIDQQSSRTQPILEHLKRRGVEVVPFDAADIGTALITEFGHQEMNDYVRQCITAAVAAERPVLTFRHAYDPVQDPPVGSGIRNMAYSNQAILRVGLDVFLEVHCGYRVNLSGQAADIEPS